MDTFWFGTFITMMPNDISVGLMCTYMGMDSIKHVHRSLLKRFSVVLRCSQMEKNKLFESRIIPLLMLTLYVVP